MVKGYTNIIGDYFDKHSFVEANIKSFNNFIEKGMQKIVNEVEDVIPTVIPQEVENFKIRLGKVKLDKPQIVEADGSRRDVYPIEARLRKLTYSSPIEMEFSTFVDGVQRENFTSTVGKLPIMLKSKYCHLYGLKRENLIEHGEDPEDLGGYFILNGNERVLVTVEDLASNKLFVDKTSVGPSKFKGKIFSERGSYRIPHEIEQMKDGLIYISFTRFRRVPIIAVIKALGIVKDQEIMQFITDEKQYDDIFVNLYNFVELKTENDALEYLAKKIGIVNPKDERAQRTRDQLDKYLLPHLGIDPKDRMIKAYNLCKMIKKFLMVSRDGLKQVAKDHYMNKRLKLNGDLLEDLFRVNLRSLIQDMLYNFQRIVKRGKFSSIKIIIREQLMTSRIKSAMATGTWIGGRKGISQNMQRTNSLDSISHLQRVVSLLTSTQENFEARALHPTMWGRLCPIETPEGTPIGLRKNLSLMCEISQQSPSEEKIKKILEASGLKTVG